MFPIWVQCAPALADVKILIIFLKAIYIQSVFESGNPQITRIIFQWFRAWDASDNHSLHLIPQIVIIKFRLLIIMA